MKDFCILLEEQLRRARQELSASAQMPDILWTAQDLKLWLESQSAEADQMCLTWARSGCWPEMSQEMAWLLSLRLCWALQMVCMMGLMLWPQQPNQRQVIEWLLVDSWSLMGVERIVEKSRPDIDEPDQGFPPPWLS